VSAPIRGSGQLKVMKAKVEDAAGQVATPSLAQPLSGVVQSAARCASAVYAGIAMGGTSSHTGETLGAIAGTD